MDLTPRNYHSREANREYMSASQYKRWLECPAATHASLQPGAKAEKPRPGMAEGSYGHAIMEGTDHLWVMAHPDVSTGGGKNLRASFKTVAAAAELLLEQPWLEETMGRQRQAEEIITFVLGGAAWKAMLDLIVVTPGHEAIVDFKFMRSLDKGEWMNMAGDDEPPRWAKVSWWEYYDYYRQLAIYRHGHGEVYRSEPDCYIAAASKEDPPDVEIYHLADHARMDAEIELVQKNLPAILEMKAGPPANLVRCERCAYCRPTKRITHPVTI